MKNVSLPKAVKSSQVKSSQVMVKRHRREPGHTSHGTVLYSTHVHLVNSNRNQVKSAEASGPITEKTCEPDTKILVLLCVVFARWDRTPNTLSESDTVVCVQCAEGSWHAGKQASKQASKAI